VNGMVNGEECVRASAGRRGGAVAGCLSAARDKGGREVPPTRPLGWESARDGSRACMHSSLWNMLWKRRGVALAVAVGFEQSDLRRRELSSRP